MRDTSVSLRDALGESFEHDFMAPRPGESPLPVPRAAPPPPEPSDPFQVSPRREARITAPAAASGDVQELVKKAYSLMSRLVDVLDTLRERVG